MTTFHARHPTPGVVLHLAGRAYTRKQVKAKDGLRRIAFEVNTLATMQGWSILGIISFLDQDKLLAAMVPGSVVYEGTHFGGGVCGHNVVAEHKPDVLFIIGEYRQPRDSLLRHAWEYGIYSPGDELPEFQLDTDLLAPLPCGDGLHAVRVIGYGDTTIGRLERHLAERQIIQSVGRARHGFPVVIMAALPLVDLHPDTTIRTTFEEWTGRASVAHAHERLFALRQAWIAYPGREWSVTELARAAGLPTEGKTLAAVDSFLRQARNPYPGLGLHLLLYNSISKGEVRGAPPTPDPHSVDHASTQHTTTDAGCGCDSHGDD